MDAYQCRKIILTGGFLSLELENPELDPSHQTVDIPTQDWSPELVSAANRFIDAIEAYAEAQRISEN
jgi:hypothetical protein